MYWNKTFYRNWIWFNSNNDWKPDPMPKLKFWFSVRTGNSRHYEYLCPLEQLKFHAQKINQSFPILPCKQGRDPLLSWQRICNVGYVTSHIFLYTSYVTMTSQRLTLWRAKWWPLNYIMTSRRGTKRSLKMDIQLNVLYAQNFYHWQIKQKSQFL